MKRCENCEQMHDGMFRVCYRCHDCETEFDYDLRRQEGEIIRKNTELLIRVEEESL